MPKLHAIRSRELLSKLKKKGFFTVRQKGSHLRIANAEGRKTTIPVHSGENIHVGLLRKILNDCDISPEEFENS